ncbi:zinc dependent phospholipase C family protein [Marininema halotolerans]|uniref:Zinc dependent phospholipase C n=1 Tax=Marininema halotolerans TaxID=1155944 RepID=A0A1I6Q321_9BACL|nr:zinc dependent phospholipase C family protein [Marininema halotolerans]SFS46899.1 Zinc dependent phospholipase C [Marininema halotolerans]
MPNVWSHIIFGHAALKRADLPIPSDPRTFQLGCQGPDFLLYHNFWPWKFGNDVVELGNEIHKRQCGPFLVDLIQAAGNQPELEEYVAGFLTHHMLDRHTHPYIVYRSGEGKHKHQQLEVFIDTLLAERLGNIRTWKTPVVPRIDIGSKLPSSWVNTMHNIARIHFPKETARVRPEDWSQAYDDMKKALRFFYDPWGIKLVLTFGYIYPFRYRPLRDGVDYLNEQEREWLHPAVPTERHRERFMTLWENALAETATLLRLIHLYWKSDTSIEEVSEKLGDISYDIGKPVSLGLEAQVEDPIV